MPAMVADYGNCLSQARVWLCEMFPAAVAAWECGQLKSNK